MFWNATVLASSVAANRDHIREVHAEIRQTGNDAANSFVNGVRGLNAQIRALPSGHPPWIYDPTSSTTTGPRSSTTYPTRS